MKNTKKLWGMWFAIVAFIGLLILHKIGYHFHNLIKDMNQAESMNHILFQVAQATSDYQREEGVTPTSLEELNLKIDVIEKLQKFDYRFLKNNENYVFIVKVNANYYCGIKGEKGNFQPTMLDDEEIPP